MSRKESPIETRRAELQRRAAAQREEVAAFFRPWQGPLSVVDQGIRIARGFQRNAPLVGAGLGLAFVTLAITRPRSIARAVRDGWSLWRAVSRFRSLLG